MNIGIDYGSNFDPETGIHYGIIPMNDLSEYAWESFESDYGEATCPQCGNAAKDSSGLTGEETELAESFEYDGCDDYVCFDCERYIDSSNAFPEEPIGQTYERTGYVLSVDSQNECWVLKSPYYTYAQYCSPCAPGAGYLRNALPEDRGAPKVYCLGPEWFDNGNAPYWVYKVSDIKE